MKSYSQPPRQTSLQPWDPDVGPEDSPRCTMSPVGWKVDFCQGGLGAKGCFLISLHMTLFSSSMECWELECLRKKTKTNQRATESCICAGCIWRVFLFTFHPARSYGLRGNSPKLLFICSASCFYLCLKTNGQINKWFVFHRLLFSGAPILSCPDFLLKKLKSSLAWESGSVSSTTKQGERFRRQTKQTAGFLEYIQWLSLDSLKSKKKKLRKRQHSNCLIWCSTTFLSFWQEFWIRILF